VNQIEEQTMSIGPSVIACSSAWQRASRATWWSQHREASLNWLALGLLLAAWNASDNEVATVARRRPESLRGYSHVSVRAATLHSGELRKTATMDSKNIFAIHKSVNVL
jgi:hypothetical protein